MSPKWGAFDWKGCAARAGTRLQWLKLEPMWTLARHVPEGGRFRLERSRGARGDTTAMVETGAVVDASPSCPRSGAFSIRKVAWRARGHDCNGRNWSRCGR